jgi:DNA polymerase-3 subunit epsilon
MLLAAIDTETTGLLPGSRMVELAVVLFDGADGRVVDTYQTLVNPGMPIPPHVTEIHGITDERVKHAPTAKEALEGLYRVVADEIGFIAHNARYDAGIIAWDAARLAAPVNPMRPVTCTLEIAKAIKTTRNNRLDTLIEFYGMTRKGEAHRALSDAHACKDYYMLVQDQHDVAPRPWSAAGHRYSYTNALTLELAQLPERVASGCRLAFGYEDKNNAHTDRCVTPYGWCRQNGALYFQGLCHAVNEERTFRADRMRPLRDKGDLR